MSTQISRALCPEHAGMLPAGKAHVTGQETSTASWMGGHLRVDEEWTLCMMSAWVHVCLEGL